MGKHCQFVMGPAGAGKSTYCATMQRHCETRRRIVHVVNLDPAADNFTYVCSIDIRDLISLDDVMSELNYGPNGGLLYALDYFSTHLDFLTDNLQNYNDDYLIIDCPGQIELYTHLPYMQTIINCLQKEGYNCAAVWCMDSLFLSDTTRFISGSLMSMSAMIQLELPHLNILTKCDQTEKEIINKYLEIDVVTLVNELSTSLPPAYHHLNETICNVLDQYSLVSYLPLDISDEESIDLILMQIDHSLQYGEDVEPQEPKDQEHEVEIE